MSQLEKILDQAKSLPPDDLVKLIKSVAEILERKQSANAHPAIRYTARFGSGKGAFQNPAEADDFLRSERELWDQ